MDDKRDAGFGLVEIIISMFLFAVVTVAVIPLIVASLNASANNISFATATQLVNEQLDVVREIAPTCDAVQTFANDPLGVLVEDPKGRILEIHRETPATCPSLYPSGYGFTVWVGLEGSSHRLAEGETRLFLESAD